MKNFDLNKFMFAFFAIVLIIIFVRITYLATYFDDEPTTPKNELKIQKNVNEPVVNDTTIVEQKGGNLWPIKVVSVEKNGNPKWMVTTENGVIYYTNKKPKVGDIAFYINDNDNITDKNGRVEITRR